MRFASLLVIGGCWSSWSAPVDTGADSKPGVDSESGEGDSDTGGDTSADSDTGGDTSVDSDTGGDSADTDSPTDPDADADGWTVGEGDCEDGEASVHPGADELCDGIDQDCDGDTDEDPVDLKTWYLDSDGDGYGGSTSQNACDPPTSSYVETPGDCDDGLKSVNPGATEVCNERDDDCDGATDVDASDALTWYEDEDEDGYGGAVVLACEAPTGTVDEGGDCDDFDATINPEGIETCDDVDQDCDGSVDEEPSDGATWWVDADADGYGDPEVTLIACALPSGASASADDCDDTDGARHPGVTELADGVDQDCDGTTDEETEVYDDDLDGFTEDEGDCDDADADTFPGATEVCDDGVVNDCEGDAETARGECFYDLPSIRVYNSTDMYSLTSGDVTGDGVDDLLGVRQSYTAQPETDGALVYPGPVTTDVAADVAWLYNIDCGESEDVGAVDLDADGVGDLVLAHGDGLYVVPGPLTGGGTLDGTTPTLERPTTGSQPHLGRQGDLTGDGADDILFYEAETDTVQVFDAAAVALGGLTVDRAVVSVGVDSNAEFVMDVDADGVNDLVAGNSTAVYFFSAPSGTLDTADAAGTVAGDLRASIPGDFDGDGNDDLVIGGATQCIYLLGAGLPGTDVEPESCAEEEYTSSSHLIGDLDGNGTAELAIVGNYDTAITVYTTPLPVVFTSADRLGTISTGSGKWTFTPSGDVTGDGLDDILVADWARGDNLLFPGTSY